MGGRYCISVDSFSSAKVGSSSAMKRRGSVGGGVNAVDAISISG